MNKRVSLILGSLAALVWATVMILFYTSGRMDPYLTSKGFFQPQALMAGIGIAVVSLFVLFTSKEKEADCGHDHGTADSGCGHDHDHEHGEGCGHDHSHDGGTHHHHEQETWIGLAVMLLILVVPVATATVFTPDERTAEWHRNNGALSNDVSKARAPTYDQNLAARAKAEAARRKSLEAAGTDETPADGDDTEAWSSFTLDDLKAQVDISESGDLMLTVPELFYTGGDKVIQDVLRGQPVETIGQVIDEIDDEEGEGRRLRVFRQFMECCSADVRPLAIPVEFADEKPPFQELGWYKITGRMSYREEGGHTVPILEVGTMTLTEEPEDATMN